MELNILWLQENIFALVIFIFTAVLVYYYLVERDVGVKLSKRYRNSIFEAQSKIFLSATQYLISGQKDLAIKAFLNAVDISRDTADTYFALGGLFRSNGEIDKAISIHRSLIAQDNISESTRLRALRELAIDFDKGGMLDDAIVTYKEVLKINRDQYGVIKALCRIYENIQDWEQAYNYRVILSKVAHENQAETISHILVQKARVLFEQGKFAECNEDLEDAFRFAPSVAAKVLRLNLTLSSGNMEDAENMLLELLREQPEYTTLAFESLAEGFEGDEEVKEQYAARLKMLKEFFLEIDDRELISSPSVVLTKVRILKEMGRSEDAYSTMKGWMEGPQPITEAVRVEYIKLLLELGKEHEVVENTKMFLETLNNSLTKHFCENCGYNSDDVFWRCPQCYEWETIQLRWKV